MKETTTPAKFACIGHPTDIEQFRGYIRKLKPDKEYRNELLIKLFEWTPAYKVKDLDPVGVAGLEPVGGIGIMVPFLPEMKEIKIREITNKIENAIKIAADQGCTIAALGGFTSIILQGQEKDISEKYNIKLTSGNTLTAAIIVRSVEQITKRFGKDLSSCTVAIIGASGDIGSGCTGYLCDKVKKLILTARGMSKLKEVVDKYKENTTCNIVVLTDNNDAISQADVVIFVTSAYQELCTLADFKPNTIVCDASFPLNVKVNSPLRPDVFVYHGGILSLPFEIDLGIDVGLAASNTFYGCQVEGVFIALNPLLPCSWGRGNISRDNLAKYLYAMDSVPGVDVAWTIGNKVYSNADLQMYSKAWNTSSC